MRYLIVLLLLLPSLALAQDQNLAPTGDYNDADFRLNDGGTACDTAACETEVDESPASPDGLEVNTGTNNASIIFNMDDPSDNPSGVTDAQTIQIISSRCTEAGVETSGGTNPNFDLYVSCGGSDHQTLVTAQTQSGIDQDNSYNWTFGGSCAADGTDVEVRFVAHRAGGGGNRRYPCIEAIEWEVTHAAAGGARRRVWVIQ